MTARRQGSLLVRVAAGAAAVVLASLSLGGSPVWAASPQPPLVTTGSASAVHSTSAILNGSANPQRSGTTVSFQYGTSGYTKSTAAQSIGGGINPVPFQIAVSGLAPGTTYHFRAVATNGNGTSYGGDQTFTTPSAAPIVTTGGASSLHQGSVTVSGTANPHGFATTVAFEYGTSTSYSKATPPVSVGSGTGSVAFNGSLTGLVPGTTYHYRAVATNANGTSYGADKTVTPAATATVTTLGATAIQAISATLTGTANPAGSATTVSFEYGTTTSYGGVTAAHGIGAGGASVGFHADITNLKPGATYHYRAVATNANGTIYGDDKTFTTTKKPTLITGGVTAVTTTSATLNGVVNPSGATTTVSFEYGTADTYGQLTAPQTIGGGIDPLPFTAKITGLSPGTTYHFRAEGTSAAGTAVGADITFTTKGGKPSASPTPTSSPTAPATVSAHPKPTGFDPLLLAGAVALGVLIVGGIAVVALARSRR